MTGDKALKNIEMGRWIGEFIKKVWFLLFLKIFFSALEGIAPYTVSKSLMLVIERITTGGRSEDILPYALLFTGAVFYQRAQMNLKMPLDTLFSARSREYVEQKCCQIVRATSLERVESAEFQEQYSHIDRYIKEVSEVWNKILLVFSSVVQLVSLTVLLAAEGWYYAVILLAGVLPLWRWYGISNLSREDMQREVQVLRNKTNYYYSMLTSGDYMKECRVFGYGEEIRQRWGDGEAGIQKLNWQFRLQAFGREMKYRLPFYGAFAACVSLLIGMIVTGRTGVGIFVGLLAVFRSYQAVLCDMFFTFSEFRGIRRGYLEIKKLRTQFIMDYAEPVEDNTFLIRKSIEFKNVWFRYPNKDNYALSDVNCIIRMGETVFIAGMNGAGKSTFIKLLTGLYRPTKGEVLYDGAEKTSSESIYGNFAVLFQDFAKFPFDFYGNVDILRSFDEEKTEDVLERAGVTEFADELPDGLRTRLGTLSKGGVNLSEGQWQRVAFARALYRDSSIYIFDEPASALDPLAEERMYELYDNLPEGVTKVIISHRLGYARKADRIIVIDNGGIAEEGTFAELYSRRGAFYDMFSLQQGLYADQNSEVKGG